MTVGIFPFGQPVLDVVQKDRSTKKVFILGVYASAVHAQWVNINGKTLVNALAVASEPTIFWRGEHADSIIANIKIPEDLGVLLPARQDFNGPSGIALDNLILNPMGLDRQDAWLCDLVPHSCVNQPQCRALEREYNPLLGQYNLPIPSVPRLPNPLSNEVRLHSILKEIIESKANTLILLGDLPIRWFLSYFDNRWKKLSDFGLEKGSYGHLHDTRLGNLDIKVLAVAHPRQIAKLGRSSKFWYDTHAAWVENVACKLPQVIM
jgi:hypothetical protein